MAALRHFREPPHHVVAEIIKTEFVVGAVGDIALVRFLPRAWTQVFIFHFERTGSVAFRVLRTTLIVFFRFTAIRRVIHKCRALMLNDTDRKTERMVNLPHPHGVAAGQIIVHRHEMRARSRERVEIERERCGERFSFTRAHFRNLSAMERDAAFQLHIIMTLTERAFRRFAHSGERFRKQIIKRFFFEPLPELLRFRLQFIIRQAHKIRLKSVDFRDKRVHLPHNFGVGIPKDFRQ